MGTILDVCDLRGPPRTTVRTPWGSMDPLLRTYGVKECQAISASPIQDEINISCNTELQALTSS